MEDSLSLGQTSRASKFQMTDDDFCEDRISDLPQIVIDHILSFIPMKDAVKTKILSKLWRYELSSLPNLVFDESRYNDSRKVTFIEFVDQILHSRDRSNIRNLEIVCSKFFTINHLNKWVSYATTRNIQSLLVQTTFFMTGIVLKKALPDHLFTSMSLKKLKLNLPEYLLELPGKIYLPKLESLTLSAVSLFNDDLTARLFSSCPILKTLNIYNCDVSCLKSLLISHPQLKELSIDSLTGISNCELKIIAPALEILDCSGDSLLNCTIDRIPTILEVIFDIEREDGDGHGNRAAQNLKAIDSTKRLNLSGCYVESLYAMSNLSARLPTLWPRMDYLYLDIDCKHLQVMASLLKTCPSLTHLEIFIYDLPTDSNECNTEGYWDMKELPDSVEMLNHLEEVSILMLNKSDFKIDSIRIFIEKAANLRRMKLKSEELYSSEEWMVISAKLRNFTKASSHAVHVIVDNCEVTLK